MALLLNDLGRQAESLAVSYTKYEERERTANPGEVSILAMRMRDQLCQPALMRPLGFAACVGLLVV